MAEVPEEVVVAIEADDRATPTLTGVGRSLVLLGSNIAYVTRALGIQNPVLNQIINTILLLGHIVRAAAAAQRLLGAANAFLTGTQVAGTAATTADTASKIANATVAGTAAVATGGLAATETAYTISTGAATLATWSWTGALIALRAALLALGPVGWAMIGLGVLGAGVAGYALGGGFGGGAGGAGGMAAVGGGPYQEPIVNINIRDANFSTKQDAEASVRNIGTLWYQEMRRYIH